jgi:hypothetical protein
MRWAGHVARVGKKKSECRFLDGKPEGMKAAQFTTYMHIFLILFRRVSA